MFCNNCGKEVEDGTKFCTNCGQKIISNKVEYTNEAKKVDKPVMGKGYYQFFKIILIILIVCSLLLSIVMPLFLIFVMLEIWGVVVCSKKLKVIKELEQIDMGLQQHLERQGYRKIYQNLYVNEGSEKINIQGKDYNFSQIIDCELIQSYNTLNSSYGQFHGNIKNNGKINSHVNTLGTNVNYCNELYINITVDDFNTPNIRFNMREDGILNTNSKKYKNNMSDANNILSFFKLVIAKNKERGIRN